MSKVELEQIWERFYGPNMGYVYDMYDKYQENPESVDASIRALFEELGSPPGMDSISISNAQSGNADTSVTQQAAPQAAIKKVIAANKLLRNIRTLGHLAANINPLEKETNFDVGFLDIETYGLNKTDLLQIPVDLVWEDAPEAISNAWEAYEHLKRIYTGTIAYEFGHIHDEYEQNWLNSYIEKTRIERSFTKEDRIELLERLIAVDGFEKFLHKTFVGQKRFSIEGLDMLVPMFDKLVQSGCEDGTKNISIGMAHRGRLNVLAHVLGKPYELIFSEFHHSPNKELVPSEGSRGINFGWSGDVKYHMGADRQVTGEKEQVVRINLAHNPSHLEFVNPVVQGVARASQEDRSERGYPKQNKQSSFSVLVHGDAAFPGEGVVAETLNLTKLNGYATGGTIHIIANNLLGFTTNFGDSRSTKYASDLAKGYEIPVIHVNADDPESCLSVMVFAYEYRKKFKKDIVIDLVGYRRFGHNEMDDANVTQPLLYEKINNHPNIADKYGKELVSRGTVTEDDVKSKKTDFMQKLQRIFDELRKEDENNVKIKQVPKPISDQVPELDTAVAEDLLKSINSNLVSYPEDFNVYPKLGRIMKKRESLLANENKVDWSLGETLAFATILAEGTPIRLTGQDSERGTFSHRHLVLHDNQTGKRFIPLHELPEAKASMSIHNSPLSEVAVLGFDYGYSVQSPESLVIWEAQFGDFVNVAQVIIDQFIASGRAKWGQKSSLVMLLPHGYEGQGPEHSSGRVERFLNSAAENNWIVANVTSAAQYFHLLRRQAKLTTKEDARPLIVMTPKSLLRNSMTVSDVKELTDGQFKLLVEEPRTGGNKEKVTRLVLCTGKVAIDLATKVEESGAGKVENVHIARVEQLYPFPQKEVEELASQFPNLNEIVWVQEEPKNMGSWPVVKANLHEIAKDGVSVDYIGRPKRSSPATGEPHIHKQEQAWIVEDSLKVNGGESK
ncbi:2-oxoglutarate dehydrogenase E1 component [Sutcliffiella rhizosphaerae]|uniref:2-oxoglutarate dehydrogenase E1 component n=1 Tax=Sutcliffiella rhizosphaerae TaxID=2880967 RepID=A0ABM8YK17_9BACI|nr:2-oxoglutarate dehydrogenase E1 component [Sutcliffiella rhizosphaerae]CAG9620214.1 2-oxoglutarate dehydrogenase E1 component [Sutcliffiella rhizosphaerae]